MADGPPEVWNYKNLDTGESFDLLTDTTRLNHLLGDVSSLPLGPTASPKATEDGHSSDVSSDAETGATTVKHLLKSLPRPLSFRSHKRKRPPPPRTGLVSLRRATSQDAGSGARLVARAWSSAVSSAGASLKRSRLATSDLVPVEATF